MFEILAPKLYSRSLADVDLDDLMRRGIGHILIDLDNTILPWRDRSVPQESYDWITRAQEKGVKLCIASNTHNPARLREVADRLGVPCFDKIGKPLRRGLQAAMETIGGTLASTAIIGDQIFTDIVGGNRLRILTVLVAPMHQREFFGTKISRLFEKPVLAWLSRRGSLGTKGREGASE